MGLDVYLYRCPDRPMADAAEKAYRERAEATWKEVAGERRYDALTNDEREQYHRRCEAVRAELGLDGDGGHPSRERVEQKSAKHPEHYFEIGYFRSSYNDGGFDRVIDRRGLPTLAGIFAVKRDDYYVAPDWAAARARAGDALEKFRAQLADEAALYDAVEVNVESLMGDDLTVAKNQREATEVFRRQLARHAGMKGDMRRYGCRDGDFMLDGLTIYAAIPGRDVFDKKCVYLIYKADAKALEWYVGALEVVVESIDYVLAQPDPASYYYVWSG